MKTGCSIKCALKCGSKITEEERQIAFDEFYRLSDKTKQWQCIGNWVGVKKPKELNEEDKEIAQIYNKSTNKNILYDFTLPSSNGQISVCRTMFINTLGTFNLKVANLINIV